jgi:hypothetical protein
MVVPRRCDKAIPISYPLKREPCDFRFGPGCVKIPQLGALRRISRPPSF